MIIQSSRVPASKDVTETGDHVFRGKANERIVVLQGAEQDLHDWVGDARRWRRKFGFRHFKISPREDCTREQFMEAVEALSAEFGFDPLACVVVGHVKPRQGGAASEFHLHVLVPEVNPVNGRVLSSRHSYPRQEKVARVLESRWGHAIVQGQHNHAVVATLRAEGRHEDADAVLADGLKPDALPQAPYRTADVQRVQRTTGKSLPEFKQAVRDARMLANNPQEFALLLNEQGLRVRRGNKDRRWIIEAQRRDDGWEGMGSVNRLLGLRVAEVERWLEELEPGGEEHGQEAANEELVGERLRRPARGRAGRGRAADAGQPGHDPGLGGGAGYGVGEPSPDELAGRPRGRRGRKRPDADRGTFGRTDRAGPPRAGEVRRGYPAPVAADSGGGDSLVIRPGTEARAAAGDGASGPGASARRLRRILEAAALEERLRASGHVAAWARSVRREPVRSLPDGTSNRTIACAEDERARRERMQRFRAMLLRRAYVLADYVPIEAVLNLRRVDVDPSGRFVLLTLYSGTQLLDTGDRITVRGTADDITITELVACAERRGWQAVEVSGTEEFRAETARALLLRGIEVMDCPLSEAEQAALRGEGPGFDWEALDAIPEPELMSRPPWAEIT